MENQLSFVPKLTLEERALRRVVINLWSISDIVTVFLFDSLLLESERYYEYEGDWRDKLEREVKAGEKWRAAIETVKDKVSELVLPKSELELPKLLQRRMKHIVKAIGSEMLRWKISLHGPYGRDKREYLDINILKQLCWTSSGTIEYQKTAEKLVCLETFDIVKRFKLACSYFLVNRIPGLWGELPEEHKRDFQNERDLSCACADDGSPDFHWIFYGSDVTQHEVYWYCVLTKSEYKLGASFNQKAFVFSARNGNKAATEYYFQKLTDEERDSSLFSTVCTVIHDRCSYSYENSDFPKENLAVILCYLLPQLNCEQQMKVFKEHTYQVLICFLDWPWQDLLDIANLIWTFLPENRYDSLLSDIAVNIRSSGYYFPKVFQNLFLLSPSNIKYFVQYEYKFFCFFPEFFFAEDIETIKIVFSNIDDGDKMKFLSSYEFFKILDGIIMTDKCDLVKLCLLETPESLDREVQKYEYMEFLSRTDGDRRELECRERKWNELFESLIKNDASTPKRIKIH